jgi:hypothetical protein
MNGKPHPARSTVSSRAWMISGLVAGLLFVVGDPERFYRVTIAP